MADLLNRIRQAVAEGCFVVSNHADDRLRERKIAAWQIEAGLEEAKLFRERPDTKPNPSVEVMQHLPDGTPVKAVWSLLGYTGVAKLVTVHFLNR